MRVSPHSDFAFGARPGVRNNRAQTVWNSAAHAVDSSNAHIFIAGRVSTKTFPGDGSYQRKPSQLERIAGLFGILRGEPYRPDDVIVVVLDDDDDQDRWFISKELRFIRSKVFLLESFEDIWICPTWYLRLLLNKEDMFLSI